jgi:hypothetical protein
MKQTNTWSKEYLDLMKVLCSLNEIRSKKLIETAMITNDLYEPHRSKTVNWAIKINLIAHNA